MIRSTKGDPPERYEIAFAVKGLRVDSESRIVEVTDHVAEVVLTSAYPRQAPQCRMLTPIFHPNIDAASICIGDHWAASESLDDLVVRIAEIITFQSYNTKSPLNGEAARWADHNESLLPVDSVDLWPAEEKSVRAAAAVPTARADGNEARCVNCGTTGGHALLTADAQGRWICRDCAGACQVCKGQVVVGELLCRPCQAKASGRIEHARQALAQGNANEACAILDQALSDFPGFQPLRDEKLAVVEAMGQAQTIVVQLKATLKAHRYEHAGRLLARVRELPVRLANLDSATELCASRCTKAGALLDRAQLEMASGGDLGEALLRRAKQVCDDHAGVNAAIERLETQKCRIPEVEGRLLAALENGDPFHARSALSELQRNGVLPKEAAVQLEAQVAVLENSRRTVRRCAVGAVILSIVVAAVTMASR
ncbi:MAG: hypothetical protein J5J06_09435 [Phycisphaerae bacterium]|nr:hypothetical protein [Phycisphaerae bacterium]